MTSSGIRALPAGLNVEPLARAHAQLRAGRCTTAHEQYLALIRETPPSRTALPQTLALLALCERRNAVLDVLSQHTGILPAVGDRQRDQAIAAVITAISDPRGRATHRPSCEYHGQPNSLRWSQVRARIRQLEYLPHLPPQARPARPQAPVGGG